MEDLEVSKSLVDLGEIHKITSKQKEEDHKKLVRKLKVRFISYYGMFVCCILN
jgi:hypothetical protein